MKSKILKILLCIETTILLLFAVYIAICAKTSGKTELLREDSPDGNYVLIIERLGEPDWPFGSDHLRISLYEDADKGQYYVSFKANVASDGGYGNYEIEWLDEGVQIALSGEEQPTAYYILPFKTLDD
jgi:hypothetical protein